MQPHILSCLCIAGDYAYETSITLGNGQQDVRFEVKETVVKVGIDEEYQTPYRAFVYTFGT